MSAPTAVVRLGHLDPTEMNIYADRGNIAVLSRRLAWRGMALEVTDIGRGVPIEAGAHDLYYLGGGQDRDQAVVADDLVSTKATGLHAAIDGGAAMLCVCGGYQLAGHGYTVWTDRACRVWVCSTSTPSPPPRGSWATW